MLERETREAHPALGGGVRDGGAPKPVAVEDIGDANTEQLLEDLILTSPNFVPGGLVLVGGRPEQSCVALTQQRDLVASTLAWLSFDRREDERMERILRLFTEREVRDELGLGGVRDSIADLLFPGTSTIQTRLRYMLFVPWLCARLEERRTSSAVMAEKLRKLEIRLSRALLEAEDTDGAFGKMAGSQLKRLPSSVYWAGLGSWGLRRFTGSQAEYFRALDGIYRLRRRSRRGDDESEGRDSRLVTWHLKLPPAPPGLPDTAEFRLLPEEAEFVRGCVIRQHPDSLLARLMADPDGTARVDYPWRHPAFGSFTEGQRHLLRHAGHFSDAMYGAALLYNILLAEKSGQDDLLEERRDDIDEWGAQLSLRELRAWDLDGFWLDVRHSGHTIGAPTKAFCERWIALVSEGPGRLVASQSAQTLIREREIRLKKANSRFRNQRALDQWGGASGLRPLSYRWSEVQTLLADLRAGLGAA